VAAAVFASGYHPSVPVTDTSRGLSRELGKWDLTAIGVNQVIGAGVFAQPAILAAQSGGWSPLIVLAVGLASMLIALSFAEVASRFDGTGGPYLYTRAAFGRFAAFEVGWMLWFTRAASWAAVINVLATSLAYYWPALAAGLTRNVLITAIIIVIALINIRGIRLSSTVVNLLTIGKLLPLAIFIAVGLAFVEWDRIVPSQPLASGSFTASSLLVIFAFGGYEVVPVTAGEAKDPRRTIPFALITTLIVVTLVMTATQLVALGTLPTFQTSTPLADSAAVFLGAAGAAMMTLGVAVSASGNNMGQALSGSRNLFALAEQGDLPAIFGRVHPRFRTPVTAIVVTAAVSLVLALSGRFAMLAAASAVTRLVVYFFTCAATLQLRRPEFSASVQPARFVVPFGPLIPATAIVVALALLAGATTRQLTAGGLALAAGAVLYLVARRTAAAVALDRPSPEPS
jgi:basic amino acid/polyamine antiporter, APA family